MRICGPILALVFTAAWGWDQNVPTISVNVNVVSLLATVHDQDGRVVKNLTQDDFELWEDGKPQKIRYFSRESNLPLTIGLLVDTSRSQTGVLDQERRASESFLEQVLREDKDQAFIAKFDKQVNVLQGLTSSRADLSAALDALAIPRKYATLVYSAVRDCSENVMRKQTGRKAFVILSDGVAFRDPISLQDAIEFAQRADTIIYSIRFAEPLHASRPLKSAIMAAADARGRHAIERMAKETGGSFYEVNKSETIETIYAHIEEALRNQYSIGYTPERPDSGQKFHQIKLLTKQKGLIVRTREGYYAK